MAPEEVKSASSESCRDVDDKALQNHNIELSDISGLEDEINPNVETRITKQFDRHIVPWLFGLWLLAFIDRSNIGNARIDGLSTDLNLGTGPKYNTVLAIFYVPYMCVDIPSNWLIKHVGAGYYLLGLVVGWGIMTLASVSQELTKVSWPCASFSGYSRVDFSVA